MRRLVSCSILLLLLLSRTTARAVAEPAASAPVPTSRPGAAEPAPQRDAGAAPRFCASPLADPVRAKLWSTPSDAEPELLDGVSPEKVGQHYYVSDEGHADRLREYVADAGGAYVGIGADQQYLYIGWARPEFAWTVDYDPHIVALHRIHQAFFLHAETKEQWQALWGVERRQEATAVVEALAKDRRDLRLLRKVWRAAAPRMRVRLWRLRKNLRHVATYLTDGATYDFVRTLIRHGCVRPLLVDVLAARGLAGIAAAAREVGLPIRTLYLSNAEEYWSYTRQFRANIRALPHDERSRVLRTLSSAENQDYRYVAQPVANFLRWLDDGKARRARSMIGRFEVAGPADFPSLLFDEDPAEARSRRAAERRARKRRARARAARADAPVVEAPLPTPAR